MSVAGAWIVAASLTGCASSTAEPGRAPEAAAPERLERHEYRRVVMGVQARIVAWAPGEDVAFEACAAAFRRMLDLERVLSDYDRGSEAMRLCARAGTGPVPVSAELYDALALSLAVSRASDGAFDVTVGPLVLLWRAARTDGRAPEPGDVAAARERVGWRGVALDAHARTAELARSGMRLDFGAIGKGLAVDAALAELRAAGLERALVELGGDLACGAPPPGRPSWVVRAGCGADSELLRLAHRGVATSGDAEQFLEAGGVRHSHVLDPRTGWALTGRTCTTVVARSAAAADALASVANVLGVDAVAAVAARLPEEFRDPQVVDHLTAPASD